MIKSINFVDYRMRVTTIQMIAECFWNFKMVNFRKTKQTSQVYLYTSAYSVFLASLLLKAFTSQFHK